MLAKLFYYLKQIAQLLLLMLVISTAMDYWRRPSIPENASHRPYQTLNSPTPTTLYNASQNQTLVLYFWGNWCGICKHTSPVINQLHQDGVPVLAIALRSGDAEHVRDYLEEHQLTFDNLNDPRGTWTRQWNIQVTPTIVLVKNGKIVHSTTGLASYWGLKTRIYLANQFM